MSFATLQYETDGPLAVITLNRPAKLNAINQAMVAELGAALDGAERDDAVRVIILCGNGRAFSAGFDLDAGDEAADGEARIRREVQADFDVIMRFWESPKVTIAAVHGYCLGSAMELAVACDITIAARGCRFGAPEVKFGSGIVALVLPWFCGAKKAKEWLLTGDDRVPAELAEQWGLVNRVVAPEELLDTARSIGREISGNDPLAVKLTKSAINRGCDIAGMRQALEQALELELVIENDDSEESREFDRILRAEGVKAAVAWRRSRNLPAAGQTTKKDWL